MPKNEIVWKPVLEPIKRHLSRVICLFLQLLHVTKEVLSLWEIPRDGNNSTLKRKQRAGTSNNIIPSNWEMDNPNIHDPLGMWNKKTTFVNVYIKQIKNALKFKNQTVFFKVSPFSKTYVPEQD